MGKPFHYQYNYEQTPLKMIKNPIQATTLVELLQQRAQNQPDKLAYTFLVNGETEKASLTYAQLEQQARIIAAKLQSRVAAGERALLLYPSGLSYIAAFFGCLYANVIAVPAYPPRRNRSDQRLKAIAADTQAAVILTTTDIFVIINFFIETLFTLENRTLFVETFLIDK
jgi:acyl-CoA synthetase (AMP-forming)/AMP-acid ligase II